MRLIESLAVQIIVEKFGLGDISFLDFANAAAVLYPLQDLTQNINRISGRRIEHRIMFCHQGIGKNVRRIWQAFTDQILAYDHHGDAGNADILLCTRIDQTEILHIDPSG